MDLPVKRAVVDPLPAGVDLGQVSRKKDGTVKARIEGPDIVDVRILDRDASQNLVPAGSAGLGDLVHSPSFQFLEVDSRLILADEGGGHVEVYLLSLGGLEADHCDAAVHHPGLKRRVADHHKVIPEVLCDSTMVVGGVAFYSVALLVNLDKPALERVEDEVGDILLRIGQPESRGSPGRGELSHDIMLGQIDFIIIWLDGLGLVGKPALAAFLIVHRACRDRHDREGAVVVDPGAGLVGLFKAADLCRGIGVRPSVPVHAGLRSPEMSTPREGDGGVGVAGRQFIG